MGKNTLSGYPKKCADYLGKSGIGAFSGHAFRRSSATIVADSGASMLSLKRHGRWKSDRVAQGYVDASKTAKLEVANLISGEKTVLGVASTSTGHMAFDLKNSQFHNCVIHFSHSN